MQGLLSALHKKKEHAQADLFLALYLNEHLALLNVKCFFPLCVRSQMWRNAKDLLAFFRQCAGSIF